MVKDDWASPEKMDSELSRRQVLDPEGDHETDAAAVHAGVQA
jgi:hypothetical protein